MQVSQVTGQILLVDGTLRFDDFIEAWRVQAKTLIDIDKARERHARRLWLRWSQEFDGPAGMNQHAQNAKGRQRMLPAFLFDHFDKASCRYRIP